MRLGLVGVDSSHAEDFLRHFNAEQRHNGIHITALWGGDDDRMTALARLSPEAKPMDSLSALLADVDAVIVGDRHGGLHRAHAIAALQTGRPVFVDKPLANSLSDATAILDAAERHGVPVLSGSALRWQAETRRLKAKLAGLDGPIALSAYGTWYPQNEYGGAIFYAIHTIELVQELLGADCSRLRLRAEDELSAVRYRSGAHDVTLEFRPLIGGSSDFGVEVKAGKIEFRQSISLGDDYMLPVCDQIAAMLRNGHGSLTREELLAPVALMEEIDVLLRAEA